MEADKVITGIYKIQSISKPERVYIGSAVSIGKRWGQHLSDLKNKKHPNKKMQNHCNKYGVGDFCFSILLKCQKNFLIKKEQYFIDAINPWFNICKQAESSLGIKRTKETREKQSLLKRNNPVRYWKGKKHSKETIEKIRVAKKGVVSEKKGKTNVELYGLKKSEEIKEKARQARLGKPSKKKGKKYPFVVPWNKGRKGVYSESIRILMGADKRGKKHSKATVEKIRSALLGQKRTEEQKEHMRKPHGKMSIEHKRAISNALRKREL
jgi:group I intron endonuclease